MLALIGRGGAGARRGTVCVAVGVRGRARGCYSCHSATTTACCSTQLAKARFAEVAFLPLTRVESMGRSGPEEQHVVQLLGVERPDSSPASRRKLPSDAPGRAGSAPAAGAPSRRAWPTAAAAEVGAGSGALPRRAAPAGCWAARADLAKITGSIAFRVAWGMHHGDPVRPSTGSLFAIKLLPCVVTHTGPLAGQPGLTRGHPWRICLRCGCAAASRQRRGP